jgi:hypothetical protein
MKKRYVVLGLSVVLALALAVPAFGGPTNPLASGSATVKGIANKALKTAKKAQQTANTALSSANSAGNTASSAQTEAKKASNAASAAQSTANTALSTANAAKTAAAAAEANANTRLKSAGEVIGTTNGSNTETSKSSTAECAAEQVVLGGGFFITGDSNEVVVSTSDNELYGHGWFATGNAIAGKTPTWAITAVAMCGSK